MAAVSNDALDDSLAYRPRAACNSNDSHSNLELDAVRR